MRPTLAALVCLAPLASAPQERLPVIDMHLHANHADSNGPPPMAYCIPLGPAVEAALTDPRRGTTDPLLFATKNPSCPDPAWSPETDEALLEQTIDVLVQRNVIGVLSGPAELVIEWHARSPDRFIRALALLEGGIDVSEELPPAQVRELIEQQGFEVLGELENQYGGIAPADPRLEPYWSMAEELDVPVGIHMGEGPPTVSRILPTYRAGLTDPYLLEDVLARHPKLRLYVMHYASPRVDEMIAMLGAYPQIYIDTGGIQTLYPREHFYRDLQRFVDAGFEKRIMFGSDNINWPGIIGPSIDIIEDAPFLDDGQKRDILYNNAARFLRLTEEDIRRHHEM